MANELYRTYEVLVEETVHDDHPKRKKTTKESRFNPEIDGALRDTHMIFQDAVCYYTLCFAGLAGSEPPPGGERGRDFLNPLWKHLTTPRSEGGIKDETERVIRRLMAHYKPLADVEKAFGGSLAEKFLNTVYSKPLQIREGMTTDEQQAALDLRAKCYRLLDKFGVARKDNGKRECVDMSTFARSWVSLMCAPESEAEIPGNGGYDRVSRLFQKWQNKGANVLDAKAIERALNAGSRIAIKWSGEDAGRAYSEKLANLRVEIRDAEQLPEDHKDKKQAMAKARKAKAELAKLEKEGGQGDFTNKRLNKRSDDLHSAAEKSLVELQEKLKAPDQGKKAATDIECFKKAAAEVKAAIAAMVPSEAARNASLIRLSYKGGNPNSFEKAMLRYWLLRKHEDKDVQAVALDAFREFVRMDKPEPEPELDGERFRVMPFKKDKKHKQEIGFPFFGKLCLDPNTDSATPDFEFDKTAFATAVEDVFKYDIRTEVRKARVRKLLGVVQAYENSGNSFSAEDSPTGKPLNVRGMGRDPRWKGDADGRKGITDLLKTLSAGKEIATYGLDEGTIGGWAEVRKGFLKLYKRANGKPKRMELLPQLLERRVDKEMEDNRQGFGSADFFHALCDPDYWHLWLEDLKNKDGKVVQKFEHNDVKDFIPHYVGYCEWREELVGLLLKEDGSELERETELSSAEMAKLAKRPIRYTWPGLLNRHKKPSYRYYDFAGDLNTAFQFKSLFRRIRARDANGNATGAVEEYKQLKGDAAKVTLAARRLKRDKIINKDTGNSVDALWCPPLILAGEEPPTTANRPRAGKYEDAKKKKWPEGKDAEVSFSLMASPLKNDPWMSYAGDSFVAPSVAEPVHLTVSFKIEANALATLQNEGVYFAGGSTKGFDEEDEKRKFFRWPADIESDQQAAQGAAQKAKREAEEKGKTEEKKAPKKTDVAPSKLWCAFNGGFLVKESRYSEAGKTKRVPDFHILSIDLGNRFAAAFTRLRIHADANGEGRVISADGFSPVIKAEVTREGTLRLQGEEAEVWQIVTEKNQKHIARKLKARKIDREPVVGNYELVDEAFGNGGRGRFPTDEEYDNRFVPLAERLVPTQALKLPGKEQTYPELGDHLVFRLKRRLGRLRTLFNLLWHLRGDKEKDRSGQYTLPRKPEMESGHRRAVMESLARSAFPRQERPADEVEDADDASLRLTLASEETWKEWRPLFEKRKGKEEAARKAGLEALAMRHDPRKWLALADAVKQQIEQNVEGGLDKLKEPPMHELVAQVVEFCLPLRGRHWRWENNPAGERLIWGNDDPHWQPNVMGMRGLSMRRLQQILDLRQRCQSFAKLEDRYHGLFKAGNYNPPDSTRDERPDCCPKLLERSNRIREQRVDQTAHLILAEALGMELKNPAEVAEKKARKAEVDLHGEYRRRLDKDGKPLPRCSVIVLENLDRYKMSLGRTKAENSRLMKWAHGKILDKLEDMCRPFGITLMLVDPAFSSHFDSRTGLPGVRVEEVSRGFEQTYPYKVWKDQVDSKKQPTKLAKEINELVEAFEKHKNYNGTLLLAVEGGKEFLPVSTPEGIKPGPINADINAAGNIGLRAVADPQRWDIFPRLRTKKVSETEVSVTNWRGWFGKFPQETKEKKSEQRRMKAAEAASAPAAAAASQAASGDGADDAGSESSQSSEYPWFFVEPPRFPQLHDGDWLAKEAYQYEHDGMKFRAFPQGAFLKRVEQICGERIKELNAARLARVKPGPATEDNLPL